MTTDTPPPAVPPVAEEPYTPPPPPPPAPPYVYPTVRQRPLGVTILAILGILFGVFLLIVAVGSFLVAGVLSMEEIISQIGQEVPQWLIDMAPLLFGAMGVVFLILAVILFLLAYGYLKGRGWAWTVSMVLAVLAIIFGVVGWVLSGFNPAGLVSMLINILIPVIIVIYLNMNHVKAWFGKA